MEPFVIILILVLNGAVAIWQDADADKALEALKRMQAVASTVLRDGKWQTIDAKDLVPGDIVQVSAGGCVPADLRVIEINSIALQAGQAALTGESVSVRKTTETLGDSAKMIQDQRNMLFSSTQITSGSAVGLVAYTGMKTAIGSIHKEVQQASEDEADTPLKQKIDQFGDYLAKVIFVICFLVWAMNFNKFFDPIHGSVVKGCIYYFKIAVALAVAAIPEGLPAVITTCLALGTRKMAANNCIVRRLPSVETLGCTSVICSDKTGTLTRNLMCAVKFGVVNSSAADIREFDVEEKGYNPNGKVMSGYSKSVRDENKNFSHIAAVCTINNRARILHKEGQFEAQGEPTEAAMKVLAEKIMISDCSRDPMAYFSNLKDDLTQVAVLDFSSERKAMSTVVTGYGGKSTNTVLLKGAPERVIEKCASVMTKDGIASSLSQQEKAQLIEKVKGVASQGYRVLAVAIGLDGGNMKHINAGNAQDELADASKYPNLESGCSFLGYVCIKDPVRPEVKQSIADCRTAGINVIMITGDAKETAIAIAKELNIITEGQDTKSSCFTGAEFEDLSNAGKRQALQGGKGKVFSRVEPRHKRELVKILIDMVSGVSVTLTLNLGRNRGHDW